MRSSTIARLCPGRTRLAPANRRQCRLPLAARVFASSSVNYDFLYHHGLLVSPGLSYFHAVQSNTLHIIGVHKSQACYCDTLLNRRPTPHFLTSVSSAYCLELHTGRLLSGQPLSQQRGDSSGPATQASRSQSILLTRSDQRGLLGPELMLDPNIYMKTGHSNSYL